jgi:putative endonuclease
MPYWTYIAASRSRVLYIGVTNDLDRRMREHSSREHPGFTARYNVNRLVYSEDFAELLAAIAREKQLKGWRRDRKVALIEAANPGWVDLVEGSGRRKCWS